MKQVVLHVRVVRGSGGGPDKTILRSARYFPGRGMRMIAAYLYDPATPGIQKLQQEASRQDCRMIAIEDRGPMDRRSARTLLQICRKLKVTTWHGHDHKSDVLGVLLRPLHAMNVITTLHGYIRNDFRGKLYSHLDALALRGMDHVIAVSPALREHAATHGVSPDRLSFIPNGIELNRYAMNPCRDIRARDRLRVGMIGRLSPEKRIDRAIHLLAGLVASGQDAQLELIGDGDERQSLEALVRGLGLGERVVFHGWCPDVREPLAGCDMLWLTSSTEGMPNAVLEAMASGISVAATDVGGVSYMLDGGRCGVVLDVDETKWPQQIRAMFKDPQGRKVMREAARKRIEQEFDFGVRMQRVGAVYERLGVAGDVRAVA